MIRANRLVHILIPDVDILRKLTYKEEAGAARLRRDAQHDSDYSTLQPLDPSAIGLTTISIADSCKACGICIPTCPRHAITINPRKPLVNQSLCNGCLECVEICPVGSISVVEITPKSCHRKSMTDGDFTPGIAQPARTPLKGEIFDHFRH